MRCVSKFLATFALFAAWDSSAVTVTAKPTRIEGAGYVETGGTNVPYTITYLKNSNGDGIEAQRTKGSVTSFWFDDYDLVRVRENCPHEINISVGNLGHDGKTTAKARITFRRYERNWRVGISPAVPGQYEYTSSEDTLLGWNRFDGVARGSDPCDTVDVIRSI